MKTEIEIKRKYDLLLKDWVIFGRRYDELNKKYYKYIKDNKVIELINILDEKIKIIKKDMGILIDCINSLGEKIDKLTKEQQRK